MTRTSRGLKALSLSCLVALATMALIATAAHAEGEFKIKGKTFAELGITEETAKGNQKTAALISVPEKNIEVNCPKSTFSTISLIKATAAVTTLKLQECTLLNFTTKAEMKSCPIGEEKESEFIPTGEIVIPLKLLARLQGGFIYTQLEPATGTVFSKIAFNEETCALPSSVELSGTIGAKGPETEAVEQTYAFDTGSKAGKEVQSLLKTELKWGSTLAFFGYTAAVALTGANVTHALLYY